MTRNQRHVICGLGLLVLGGCVKLTPSSDGTTAFVPSIAVGDGVQATLRKPRGTGLVVGIAMTLDD